MKIAETYSHLNGLEFLLVHHKDLWDELTRVVNGIHAEVFRTKESKEKRTMGRMFYNPVALNLEYKRKPLDKGWQETRVSYWVTRSEKLIRKTLSMEADHQKLEIESAGETPIRSYNQTDFVKNTGLLLKFSLASMPSSLTTFLSSTWHSMSATRSTLGSKYFR